MPTAACYVQPAKKQKVDENGKAATTPAAAAAGESTTVFVGNLPWSAGDDDIRGFFDGLDVKSVRIATDQNTGRARGFCHVEFASADDATKALEYNGSELNGRQLKVDACAPRQGGGGGGAGGFQTPRGGAAGGATEGNTVFVKGFDKSGEQGLGWVSAGGLGCCVAYTYRCRG